MRWIAIAMSAWLCFWTASGAHAEATVAQVLELQSHARGQRVNNLYMSGLIAGFRWYSTLDNRGEKRLYCPPSNIAITPEQAVDILRRFKDRHPEKAALEVGQGTLLAFQEVFPCSQ